MSLKSDGPTSSKVGLQNLPTELLQSIFLLLPLPTLIHLSSLSSSLHSLISAPLFHHIYTSTPPSPWLFLFQKCPPHSSLLIGFHPSSTRWFNFPTPPDFKDMYFLDSSGDFFLFVSNKTGHLFAYNVTHKNVSRIPDCPLGPRSTSSWRRNGFKLLSDNHTMFTFLFAEMCREKPVLFEYNSMSDTWSCREAAVPPLGTRRRDGVYLNVGRFGNESVVLCSDGPVVYRPLLREGHTGERMLHVYGDGYMALVRSTSVIDRGGGRARAVEGVEMWGLSSDGSEWELVSRVGEELVMEIRKPYCVMTGCLEEKGGVVRLVLMCNCKGVWDFMWLDYDRGKGVWEWVPVPNCGTVGLNMAGISMSTSFVGFKPAT